MAALLPAKLPRGWSEKRQHADVSSVHRQVRLDWEVMACADGLFDAALAAKKVTRARCVAYIQEMQARSTTGSIED